MRQGRERLLVVPDDRYENDYAEVYEAADHAPDQLQAGVEAIVELAEINPEGAREGLWRLQADWKASWAPADWSDPCWRAHTFTSRTTCL